MASTTAASEPARRARAPYVAPLHFAAGAAAALIGAGHELLVHQPALYLEPYGSRWTAFARLLGLAAFGLGASWAWRRRLPSVAPGLAALALVLAASGPALFFAASEPLAASAVLLALTTLGGATLGLAAVPLGRALAPLALSLGAMERLVSPLRLASYALLALSGAAAAGQLGVWRCSAALAVCVGSLALLETRLFTALRMAPEPSARRAQAPAFAALLLALGSVLLAGSQVTFVDLARYELEVVFTRRADTGERVLVTSGQRAMALFVDDQLRVSQLDTTRYAELLVHPGMTAALSRRRVLLLGDGHGAVERELLRYPDVESLTVVTPGSALPALAQRFPWLTRLNGGALADRRVTLQQAESAPWVESARGSYDVIVVDLADPLDHAAGKQHTRWFFRELRRLAGARGVVVLGAGSPLRMPRTFATLRATLRASAEHTSEWLGSLPTIGEWAFFMLSAEPLRADPTRLPPGLRTLDAARLPRLFVLPADVEPTGPEPPPSTLHDMHAVELLQTELAERTRGRLHR